MQMFKWQFASAGVMKLICDSINIVQPLLLSLLIKHVNNAEGILWQGIGIAIVMFAALELRSLLNAYYLFVMLRTGTKLQCALTNAVYNKVRRRKNNELYENFVHLDSTPLKCGTSPANTRRNIERNGGGRRSSPIIDLANSIASCERATKKSLQTISFLIFFVCRYWSAPYQIILALIMLFLRLGIAALPGCIVMVMRALAFSALQPVCRPILGTICSAFVFNCKIHSRLSNSTDAIEGMIQLVFLHADC